MRDATAYQVHSCLAESLEVGTADKAFAKYGLRKFPVGGKTGTAYNFTDVWFVGYSSAITCGVWAGFDKPRTPIYRGAFSGEVALPVWVEIMNATFSRYPAGPIEPPPSLKRAEICAMSGALKTDRCFEERPDVAGGEMAQRSTVAPEWGTAEQLPDYPCPVHGDAQAVAAAQVAMAKRKAKGGAAESSAAAKAQLAADLTKFAPVYPREPAVIGEDPYRTAEMAMVVSAEPVVTGSVVVAEPVGGAEVAPAVSGSGAAPVGEPGLIRAEPIRALETQPQEQNVITLDAPPPLEF
jgi:penicillin-binding protein 1A